MADLAARRRAAAPSALVLGIVTLPLGLVSAVALFASAACCSCPVVRPVAGELVAVAMGRR